MTDNSLNRPTRRVKVWIDNTMPERVNSLACKRLVEHRDGYLSPTPVDDAAHALASDLRRLVQAQVDAFVDADTLAEEMAYDGLASVGFIPLARRYLEGCECDE